MSNPQTIEQSRGLVRRMLLVPALVAALGGALLSGGRSGVGAHEAAQGPEPIATSQAAGAVSLRPTVDDTITGDIETLNGESVAAVSDPNGGQIVRQIPDDSEVQIVCQAPGANAPGNPANFGKPPLADTTWYKISSVVGPSRGTLIPSQPELWVPQNPVFTDGTDQVPSCPR